MGEFTEGQRVCITGDAAKRLDWDGYIGHVVRTSGPGIEPGWVVVRISGRIGKSGRPGVIGSEVLTATAELEPVD